MKPVASAVNQTESAGKREARGRRGNDTCVKGREVAQTKSQKIVFSLFSEKLHGFALLG